MADGFDCDVLVVGLGPVGAALTALLAVLLAIAGMGGFDAVLHAMSIISCG